MKEQLDLTVLLKDCPSGMELDCTMYDNVTLKSVSLDINGDYPISIETKSGFVSKLTKYGQNVCVDDAKCVIFPKGKKTWEGFQRPFIDGDIVINKNNIGTWIGIYHKDDRLNETFSSYCYIRRDGIFCANSDNNHGYYETRLATKEEKEKFFQVVKDHGYKWNPKTKTLEKLIVPKFKVGDKVKHKDDVTVVTITGIKDDYYFIQYFNIMKNDYQNEKVSFKDQDLYELTPNNLNPKFESNADKSVKYEQNYTKIKTLITVYGFLMFWSEVEVEREGVVALLTFDNFEDYLDWSGGLTIKDFGFNLEDLKVGESYKDKDDVYYIRIW